MTPASTAAEDARLLDAYVRAGSRSAFDQLVARHVDFVYAVAKREVHRDPHLAEDVTQAVFLVLARRAGRVRDGAALPGWLFNTARFAARNATKTEGRRRRHERRAAEQRAEADMQDPIAQAADRADARDHLAPQLNAALARLKDADRTAVLMRFMQGMEFADVAAALGTTEAAVRKRIERAVGRLRAVLAARGVTAGAVAIEAALRVTEHAPAGLATAPPTAAGAGLADGAARSMTLAAAKPLLVAIGVAAAVVLAVAVPLLTAADPNPSAPAAAAAATAPPAEAQAVPQARPFDLTVTEQATGQPVAGAAVEVYVDGERSTRTTDAAGRLRVMIPPGGELPPSLVVRVDRPPLVPVTLTWRNDALRDPIPPQFTVALEAGTQIGGVVTDPAGQPVVGATVSVVANRDGPDPHERHGVWDAPARTAADGRWTFDRVPARHTNLMLRLSHGQYVSDTHFSSDFQPQDLEQLRATTYRSTMKKGFAVAGRVTDATGKPVSGAKVAQGDDRWGSHFPDTLTNAAGEFRFTQSEPAKMTLTVQAKGYAPDLRQVDASPDAPPVEFKLAEGVRLAGRVVDVGGKPVAGATVIADTWRGKRTLEWRTTSRVDGHFEWPDAPADPVEFHVLAREYQANRQATLTAAGPAAVQTVTMRPVQVVTGTVVDADTNAPIPKFRVKVGRRYRAGDAIYWERDRSGGEYAGGAFTVRFGDQGDVRLVRVQADGYLPALSREIRADEGDVSVDLEMQPGQNLSGLVRSPGGAPAARARVILAQPGRSVSIVNGEIQRHDARELRTAEAGDDGRFSLPPEAEPMALVVLHESGYAVTDTASLATDPAVKLTPWARVELAFPPQKGEPAAGRDVRVWMSPVTPDRKLTERMSFSGRAKTDGTGRATFDRLPAGEGGVSDHVQLGHNTWGGTVSHRVQLKAGETAQVALRLVGRPIVGRLAWAADSDQTRTAGPPGSATDVHTSVYVSEDVPMPSPLPYPTGYAAMPLEQRRAWWASSPELAAYREQRKADSERPRGGQSRNGRVAADGTFRIDRLAAGSYRLGANATFHSREGGGTWSAAASKPFVVPPIEGESSDEVLDLGTIELAVHDPATDAERQRAAAATRPAAEPGTPAAAYAAFQRAMADADADAALAAVDLAPPAAEPWVRRACAMAARRFDLHDVAVAAFGNDAAQTLARVGLTPRGRGGASDGFGWTVTGDRAVAADPRYAYAGTLVRVEGQWKLALGEQLLLLPPNVFDDAAIDKQLAKLDQVLADVKAGKFRTAEELVDAMRRD